MASDFQAICGANRAMDADLVGCGKPILNQRELYRCTDCSVPFHRECAIRHFATDNSEDHREAAYAEQFRRWDENAKAAGAAEYASWAIPTIERTTRGVAERCKDCNQPIADHINGCPTYPPLGQPGVTCPQGAGGVLGRVEGSADDQ